jgi:hypothetical protein
LPKFKTRFLVGAKLASPCLFEPSERAEQAQKQKYSEMKLSGQQDRKSECAFTFACRIAWTADVSTETNQDNDAMRTYPYEPAKAVAYSKKIFTANNSTCILTF